MIYKFTKIAVFSPDLSQKYRFKNKLSFEEKIKIISVSFHFLLQTPIPFNLAEIYPDPDSKHW